MRAASYERRRGQHARRPWRQSTQHFLRRFRYHLMSQFLAILFVVAGSMICLGLGLLLAGRPLKSGCGTPVCRKSCRTCPARMPVAHTHPNAPKQPGDIP